MSFTEKINLLPGSLYRRDPEAVIYKEWAAPAALYDEARETSIGITEQADIETAKGRLLDLIGSNVNEPRNGRDDVTYRAFIKLAIFERNSTGSLRDFNYLKNVLSADGLTVENPVVPPSWDGSVRLDGSLKLNDDGRPATIEILFENVDPPPYLGEAISRIRRAGVNARVRCLYTFDVGTYLIYTQYTKKLDGTWLLDGKKNLHPDYLYLRADEAAIGDGAHPGGVLRAPQPGDSGLQHELVRKPAFDAYAPIYADPGELDGKLVDEIALFLDGSVVAVASFAARKKPAHTVFDFRFIGEQT